MQTNLAFKHQQEFTYRDYLTWPGEEKWQIVNGIAYNISPSPSIEHQLILVELSRQFANYLLDKTCKIIFSPVDVVLK